MHDIVTAIFLVGVAAHFSLACSIYTGNKEDIRNGFHMLISIWYSQYCGDLQGATTLSQASKTHGINLPDVLARQRSR